MHRCEGGAHCDALRETKTGLQGRPWRAGVQHHGEADAKHGGGQCQAPVGRLEGSAVGRFSVRLATGAWAAPARPAREAASAPRRSGRPAGRRGRCPAPAPPAWRRTESRCTWPPRSPQCEVLAVGGGQRNKSAGHDKKMKQKTAN